MPSTVRQSKVTRTPGGGVPVRSVFAVCGGDVTGHQREPEPAAGANPLALCLAPGELFRLRVALRSRSPVPAGARSTRSTRSAW